MVQPTGWNEAWRRFADGGWVSLGFSPENGGQGLPKSMATPVLEMWFSANAAFSMLPQLNTGAAEAILLAANTGLKATYLKKLVTGEWAGTMNITEPQAGSDLAAIRTKAEPQADGSCRLSGQKIFISYGAQANDLVGRKVLRENGATLRELMAVGARCACGKQSVMPRYIWRRLSAWPG